MLYYNKINAQLIFILHYNSGRIDFFAIQLYFSGLCSSAVSEELIHPYQSYSAPLWPSEETPPTFLLLINSSIDACLEFSHCPASCDGLAGPPQ